MYMGPERWFLFTLAKKKKAILFYTEIMKQGYA